jgi:hypothetical protein
MKRKAVRGPCRIPLHEVAGLIYVGKEQWGCQPLGECDGRLKYFGMLAGNYADEQGRLATESLWRHIQLCSRLWVMTSL